MASMEKDSPIVIMHRRNTRQSLRETPSFYGVEVDIRSRGSELIVHHDAFAAGEPFADWLSAYSHRLLILNVKEEGLEAALLKLMKDRHIEDFFFLDQSFPFLIRTARTGERRCAVRVSEFESIETALALADLVDWVWVDCFSRFPLSGDDAMRLQKAGLRLCLVSPQLQGRDPEQEIPTLRTFLRAEKIAPAAVCTKRPELWAASG